MRKLYALIVSLVVMVGLAASAQTLTVSGSKIIDSTGSKLASGTITFAPVDVHGKPLSYRMGGNGQVLSRPVTATVTNGAFSLPLPDTSLTNPANVCFAASLADNVTGQNVLGAGYSCVQPSSASSASSWCTATTCNFDAYVPNNAALPVTTISGGGTGGGSTYTLPGATSGALGGVQLAAGQSSATLAKVATSGVYADLSGLPTIPSPFNGGTVTNPIAAPSFTATGTGAGAFTLTAGPAPTAPTNSVVLAAPSAVTTPYVFSLPAAPPGSTALTMSCSGTTATICNWVTASSGLGNGLSTGVNGGPYSVLSFNGSYANGLDLGFLADTSGSDKKLYYDVPSGGVHTFRVNNAQVAVFGASSFTLPMGIQAQNYSNTYDDISFNGNHADGTRFGFVWDNSFVNKTWYFDVPSGGGFDFRVGGTALPSATVSVGCGTLTFTNGLLTGKTGTC